MQPLSSTPPSRRNSVAGTLRSIPSLIQQRPRALTTDTELQQFYLERMRAQLDREKTSAARQKAARLFQQKVAGNDDLVDHVFLNLNLEGKLDFYYALEKRREEFFALLKPNEAVRLFQRLDFLEQVFIFTTSRSEESVQAGMALVLDKYFEPLDTIQAKQEIERCKDVPFFNAQSFARHLSFENQLKIADLLPDFWKRFRRFSRAAPHEGLRILMTRPRLNVEEFSSLPSMLKMLYFAQLNPDEAELLKEAMLAFIEKMRSFSAKKWHALWNATLEGSAADLLSCASSVEEWQGRILKTSYREQEKLTQTYLETKEAPPLGLLLRGLDPKTSAERRRLRTFLRFMLEAHPRIVFFLTPHLEKIDAKTEGSSLCQLAGVIRRKEMQCFAEDIVSMVSLGAELEALERISLLTFGYSWFTDAETLLEAVEKRALHPETIARERRHLFLFLDNWLKFRLRQEPSKRVHRVMRHMSRFDPFQGDIELCKAVMRFKSSWMLWQSILRAGQLSSSSCRSNEIIEDVEGLMAEYLEGTEKEKAVKLIAQDMKGNAQEMLRQIPLEEFHKELWSKGTLQGEGFQHMVSEWNLITQRTKLILLKEGYTPVQRARLIELFIEVAHKLIASRDYYSAYALYGVFHASEIVRLKESWADVGMEFKAQLAEFDGLFALDNNYQALRTRLAADRESGKGFIPPLNLLTKDLTFTLEKQDRLFGVVNANKLFLICRFLRDFNSCQVMNGTKEVRLRTNFTASMHTLTASDLEVDLWAMSLKREPKKRPAKQAQN